MSAPICVIPARMASSRYPGKPLAPILGLPLVLHVWHRCLLYERFSDVLIATCDPEIIEAAERHGARAVLTSDRHERATDRVQEAVETQFPDLWGDRVVVMVQGDELLVSPDLISLVIEHQRASDAPVVNLGSRLRRAEDRTDPNTVKVVAAPDGHVLYFSRAPIPSATRRAEVPAYQQTGVMAFTWNFLVRFAELSQTPLEIAESVDMLRPIEHGIPVHIVLTETETIGVDTPADRDRGEELLAADPLTARYLEGVA